MKAVFVSCLLAATLLPDNSDGFQQLYQHQRHSTTALDAILPQRKQQQQPSATDTETKPLRRIGQRISTPTSPSSSASSSSSTPTLLKKISSRSIKRVAVSAEQDESESESAPEQLAKLEAAAAANKDEWATMLKAKLEEWKEMKAAGILDKLMVDDEAMDEEMIIEMDDMSKRLLRRQRGKGVSSKKEGGPEQEGSSKEQILFELREKLLVVGGGKDGTSLGTLSLLNEIKDKAMVEADPKLVEDALMALTRLDSSSMAVAGFKMYQKWVAEGRLEPLRGGAPATVVPKNDSFGVSFANACFATSLELVEAGRKVMDLLIAEGSEGEDFLPGLACAAAYGAPPCHTKAAPGKGSGVVTDELLAALAALTTQLGRFRADQVNPVIRALGRRRLSALVFDLLDAMRAGGVVPNDESLEFLANALVVTVNEDAKAKSMKDLPDPDLRMPEIVFVGRSNVGKSSLVNFLVNRKALASVDPTPGHTTQFHFFGVNRDRDDLPSFYLVDVPGLGYAEADEGRQDSWRSLLERYLTVRDSLGAVFHLIDSRHQLTATDRMMIDIASRAAAVRQADGRPPFLYTVVLTKVDKAGEKQLRQTEKDVRAGLAEGQGVGVDGSVGGSGGAGGGAGGVSGGGAVSVLKTSATARIGRDDVWKLLQGVLQKASD